MKKTVLLFYLSLFTFHFSLSQNPLVKQWDKRFGGNSTDRLTAFQQTKDGGYILGGWTISGIGGDKTQASNGDIDYWIVKIDFLGNKQWDKDFGGTNFDFLSSLQQTTDGGYILGGDSYSGIGGDKTQPNQGSRDYWIVKVDSIGNKQWDKDFGGFDLDYLCSLQQTNDGGYILGGNSVSGISGDKTQATKGAWDYWIIKIDSLGNKQWDKDFGGISNDYLFSSQQTNDGGYILGGYSYSGIGGDKTQVSRGAYDYWIIKIDSLGNKQWDKDFGGIDNDWLYSLQQTTDGGYILGGYSSSGIGGDKTQALNGGEDFWIVKIDSLGNKQWDKDFGGSNDEDEFGNIYQTNDGGYLIAGTSYSLISGDKTEINLGPEQTWIVKTDSLGNKKWDKTLFTLGHNETGLGLQTKDGCYAFANYDDGGVGGYRTQGSRGGDDYWIIKFCDTTTAALPVANFISSDTAFCNETGKCIDFTDKSTYNPTSWQWSFPGAVPSSSTQQNPTNICYYNSGTYAVTLIVSNSSGSNTLTATPMITMGTPLLPSSIYASHDTLYCSIASSGYSYQWFLNANPIAGATNYYHVITQQGTYAVQVTDSIGCSSLSAGFTIDVEDIESNRSTIKVHPNPASDVLWIEGVGKNAVVKIYNTLGEELYPTPLLWTGAGGEAFNIRNLPSGLYFIEVCADKILRTKFIKQ